MNTKELFNKIQERIALDNFKIENARYKKKTKRFLIVGAALVIITVGLLTINIENEGR